MSKKKNIKKETVEKLKQETRFGESKKEARIKENTRYPEGIFAHETQNTYTKQCLAFCSWLEENHPVRSIKYAQQYVGEYLEDCIAKNHKPATIHTKACALAKLYKCHSYDFGIVLPKRTRASITRSRTVPDKKIEEKNGDIVYFIKGTGLRKHEVERLSCMDVFRDSANKLKIYVAKGKGGRPRTVEVLEEYAERIEQMAEKANPNKPMFGKVPKDMNAHYYRACYAQDFYDKCARTLDTLSTKEKYYMRKDRKGDVYDRLAMKEVSQQLGHCRISVIAGHYLYTVKEA